MAIYDGVVTLADDEIPVIVELDDAQVRLTASGIEIGRWAAEEIDISPNGDATFTITAENETLEFVPNQPRLFAAALNGASEEAEVVQQPEPRPDPPPADRVGEAPPPKPLTMGLFYALCVVTAALALWSLIVIIF